MILNAFHVVRCAHNDVFRTYAIYHNNVPYLDPTREQPKLGRKAAYEIVAVLNRADRFGAK